MVVRKLNLLKTARECLDIEIEAIQKTAELLDESFAEIIMLIHEALQRGNKTVFTGVGKNRPVCQKIVGTLNSTGVPSCFLDPADAMHGDMGLCVAGDLVFLMSNSGQTEELLRLLNPLKRLKVVTVAFTSQEDSELVRNCDFTLRYAVPQEACPLNLAPTASTTASLALGDALAMAYVKEREFTSEDFAKYHPAGSLGQSLLLRVDDLMRSGERFACLPETATIHETITETTRAWCGTCALVDAEKGTLVGVFSDGDFRRAALKARGDVLKQLVGDFMTRKPKSIQSGNLAVEALKVFEKSKINNLIVVDLDNRPIGIIDNQDLPKLKIV